MKPSRLARRRGARRAPDLLRGGSAGPGCSPLAPGVAGPAGNEICCDGGQSYVSLGFQLRAPVGRCMTPNGAPNCTPKLTPGAAKRRAVVVSTVAAPYPINQRAAVEGGATGDRPAQSEGCWRDGGRVRGHRVPDRAPH